jgi:hypothetical protein
VSHYALDVAFDVNKRLGVLDFEHSGLLVAHVADVYASQLPSPATAHDSLPA